MVSLVLALLIMVSLVLADPGSSLPNGHAWGCSPGNISASLPFCNASLSISARVKDLVGRLTLQEKVGLMSADSNTHVNSCNMMDHGVPRFGIPSYMHLVEANTAIASTCLAENKCSTNYPGPTGLGASFNRSLWAAKGDAMGDEIRAFNNLRWYRATGDAPNSLIGLNGYGPNLNIARDPRYGRISELPGEDPFLSGTYAVEMVRAAQGMDAYEKGTSKYLKMTLGLKHYALYNVEANRAAFIPNVTAHDLWETYLPQYALGFSKTDADGHPAGNAMGTMCSYAGLNGVPSCGNDFLLNSVIRQKFGRDDVVVGTDCGAVSNMFNANHYAASHIDAATKTCNGGTDLELGDQYWSPAENGGEGLLEAAVNKSLVQKSRIDASVSRVLRLRFLTGQFDPLDNQPYASIGAEVINSTSTQQLNLEAALQSFVLLKNDDNALPLTKGKMTAVLGPHVFSTRDLMSDYKGDEQCVGGGDDYSCLLTIAEAFTRANGAANTLVEQGVELDSNKADGIPAALAAAQAADQVLLFLGIGNTQEHEGIDRMNTSLPGLQESFAIEVLSICTSRAIPCAVVLINGGAVAIDSIVPRAKAIVEGFYPSVRGAEALALTLFGQENRWGKLPVTMYNKDYINQVDFLSFDMSKAPGRTYKYYTGTPLFPFGWGLSYTEFSLSCKSVPQQGTTRPLKFSSASEPKQQGHADANTWTITCDVSVASGSLRQSGEEVLMVFHRVSDDIRNNASHPVPIKELVQFQRIAVQSSTPSTVKFTIGQNQLGLVDKDGNRQLVAGTHFIDVTNGVANTQTLTFSVSSSRVLDKVPRSPMYF